MKIRLPLGLRPLQYIKKFIMKDKDIVDTTPSALLPPDSVQGMTTWRPELFRKTVNLPHVDLPARNVSKDKAGNILKPHIIKLPNFPRVREIGGDSVKRVVCNPTIMDDLDSDSKDRLTSEFGAEFGQSSYDLDHSNYTQLAMLKQVLPKDIEGLTSSQIVGHITYVNLKDELLPYKSVIGEIILSTSPRAKLVVTKTNIIENKFRNLDLEILAGDPKAGFVVEVRENECRFELDFSKVYWNPRLSTEHFRVFELIKTGDKVFDVFAGIGPFAIPIAKRKKAVVVHANDLNPESHKYLVSNVKLNKIPEHKIKCYNLDGAEFIKTIVKSGLEEHYRDKKEADVHIPMNLPALATEFLPNFKGLLTDSDLVQEESFQGPMVHVYAFSNAENKEADLKQICQRNLDCDEIECMSVNFVRNVSANKDMFRISFRLPYKVLFSSSNDNEAQLAKRAKLT